MRHRIWSAALAAAALIMAAAQPARADGYPIRDGTGASQTFCSKLVGGLQYPCHLIYGMFGSTPSPVTTDGQNLNVHVQASELPSGASTAANQSSQLTQETAVNTVLGLQADSAWSGTGSGTLVAIDKYIAAKVEASRALLAGTLTVQFASPQAVTQSGTWNITNISGTVSLPTGAATSTNQTAPQASAGSDASKAIAVQGVTGGKAVTASDAYNAPFTGVTNMPTDATTYTAGRSFEAECTVAGAVTVTFSDASTRTINVSVGDNIRPYAITAWTLSGVTGPATCAYANLK